MVAPEAYFRCLPDVIRLLADEAVDKAIANFRLPCEFTMRTSQVGLSGKQPCLVNGPRIYLESGVCPEPLSISRISECRTWFILNTMS